MAPRWLLYVTPTLAVCATAMLVLGPGRERPAIGARVWGIPAPGSKAFALRIETVEREFGADRTLPVENLTVEVSQPGKILGSWQGSSGPDGIAEALVPLTEPLPAQTDIAITRGKTWLARGPIHTTVASPLAFERHAVEGITQGDLAIRVEVDRGVLAAPFWADLVIAVSRGGEPALNASVRGVIEGAEVGSKGPTCVTDGKGKCTLQIRPMWHAVDLKVQAESDTDPVDTVPQAKGSWEGVLPVKPGALWLSPDLSLVVSPVPRPRVYVSALTSAGRAAGWAVDLKRTDTGLFEAPLDAEAIKRIGATAVTVAGDPQEQGAGTVTWPAQGGGQVTAAPRVEMLFDGVPFAENLEKKRAGKARLASVGVVFAAGILEAVLLVLHSRAMQAALSAHLARASETAEDAAAASKMTASAATRAFTLVAAVGLVLLAFGAVAAFAMVR
ncbi:MAG: hypothetical protein IPK82_28030 [Polyangiaceae bacterium]|nr:hypothetical protein [Polyangiaceae bacterium]